jgi:hypothetical protein
MRAAAIAGGDQACVGRVLRPQFQSGFQSSEVPDAPRAGKPSRPAPVWSSGSRPGSRVCDAVPRGERGAGRVVPAPW